MQEVALLAIGVLVLVSRAAAGTWVHPSVLTNSAWFATLAIPTLSSRLNPAPTATLIITCVVATSTLISGVTVKADAVTPSEIVAEPMLLKFVVGGAGAGLLAGLIMLRTAGYSVTVVLSHTALALASSDLSLQRYGGQLHTPVVVTVLLLWTYAAALAAPYVAAGMARGRRRLLVTLAPTGGAAIYSVATTARASFLITFLITGASWLVCYAMTYGGRPAIRLRSLLTAVLAAGVVASAFVYIAVSRFAGYGITDIRQRVTSSLAIYTGGGLPAYDAWLAQGGSGRSPQLGMSTFAGLTQFFTGDRTAGSAYSYFTAIGPGLTTNVYSILRPLTEDFTPLGAGFFLAGGSIVAAALYRRAVLRRNVKTSRWVAAWLAFVFFANTTSIYTFANVTLGVLLGGYLVGRWCTAAPPQPACGTSEEPTGSTLRAPVHT